VVAEEETSVAVVIEEGLVLDQEAIEVLVIEAQVLTLVVTEETVEDNYLLNAQKTPKRNRGRFFIRYKVDVNLLL
jgi:hypothetical protein